MFDLWTSPHRSFGGTAIGTYTIDDPGLYAYWAFQTPEADTWTDGGIAISSINSNPQISIGLETISTSTSKPSGTDVGGGSPTKKQFDPSALSPGFHWFTFTNSYTSTRGEALALVVRFVSGGGNRGITVRNTITSANFSNFPQAGTNASTMDQSRGWRGFFASLKSSTRVIYLPAYDLSSDTTSSSGHRIAMKFRLSSSFCNNFKVKGLRNWGNISYSAAAFTMGLWNASGTALQTGTADTRFASSLAANSHYAHYFNSMVTLNPDTWYYIGYQQPTATVQVVSTQVGAASDLNAYPLGTDCYYSYWNGSSWADATTKRPNFNLIMESIT